LLILKTADNWNVSGTQVFEGVGRREENSATCVRLVLSSVAIRALDIFFFLMASASCHATTSLTACACASSKMPSQSTER
jgi:hypothetical protein